MTIRIAINGFGRIGRLFFRACMNDPGIDIMCINDIADAEKLAYLLKYDTVHGRLDEEVRADGNFVIVGERRIQICQERNPEKLPYKELGVRLAVECTGLFTSMEGASRLKAAGAQIVVVSAPSGDIPMYVMGVNHASLDIEQTSIISNASCTTNCLAPVAKVVHENFDIVEGLMTTVHSLTATQKTCDGPSGKDWRGGRAAGHNIIPASTGAAKAVGKILPELNGKLTGMAFRVPTADVSAVDLTVRLGKKTSYEEICNVIREASESYLKGILDYTEDAVVSSDFIGDSHSSIFDAGAGIELSPTFFKLISWYDNEWGYSNRLVDLIRYIASLT